MTHLSLDRDGGRVGEATAHLPAWRHLSQVPDEPWGGTHDVIPVSQPPEPSAAPRVDQPGGREDRRVLPTTAHLQQHRRSHRREVQDYGG